MVTVQLCTAKDIPELARMNRQLDEAVEGACKRGTAELEATLRQAMEEYDHQAFFFKEEGRVAGYALCDRRRQPVYIRQFYIVGDDRRRGTGQRAFAALRAALGAGEVSLDCHVGNTAALAFWRKLGFKEKHVHMVLADGKAQAESEEREAVCGEATTF